MGLKYSYVIPDLPKTRRFQELNGIEGDALRASVGLKLSVGSEYFKLCAFLHHRQEEAVRWG